MSNADSAPTPIGNAAGFVTYFWNDFVSGFLVFLIALPLCLGISIASGYPPISGIFTAIIGSVVCTFISNSELTIKGPAAGLIVIAIGCINDFGGPGSTEAYQAALAVGVAAAVLQILFGSIRAGILGEFFPVTVVHGMLAAIGVIIIIKQIPVALGVVAKGEPLEILQHIPQFFVNANPAIAGIGLVSIVIMFLWPLVARSAVWWKAIPAPVVVLVATIPMGMYFDLMHPHQFEVGGHRYELGEQYLVDMPREMFGMFQSITFPDFSNLLQWKAWNWVLMFFVIGTLESLLSAKAIDLLDPWKRKSNMNRDVVAVGIANLCSACVGGLPMISEIVRSKANIDNGARTRFADFWHGMFLLACVAFIPFYLHRIPLAALAGMLVYTGFRLAHPTEFVHIYRIGKEQLAIFLTTLVTVLATDLLVGVGVGIVLKVIIHLANGMPLRSLFKPFIDVQEVDSQTTRIIARESAVFSNWIPFKRQIENIGLVQQRNLVIDLSDVKLIDHSVMGKLEEMQREFERESLSLTLEGLDNLQPLANNAHAARKQGLASLRRLTVTAEAEIEEWLERNFVELGATGFTVLSCRGAGRRELAGLGVCDSKVRIEVVMSLATCERIVQFLRTDVLPVHHVTACIETVDVVRRDQFEEGESFRNGHLSHQG